jgi:hypothetical protein
MNEKSIMVFAGNSSINISLKGNLITKPSIQKFKKKKNKTNYFLSK